MLTQGILTSSTELILGCGRESRGKLKSPMQLFSILFCVSLVGCHTGALPSASIGGSAGGSGQEFFEKVGQQLDNPQSIFAKAGYQPLWTASKSEAASRLPSGLKVVPKEVRVWEPEFRKHLTIKGKQLSTGELLQIKWTVIQAVAKDPASQFVAGQSDMEVFQNVEAVRVKALASMGLDDSNPVLFQITRADAAWARCKSQRAYEKGKNMDPSIQAIEDGKHPRYPTLSEFNQQNYKLNCIRSDLEMIYILRGMEKLKPSGLKIGCNYAFHFSPEKGTRIGHGAVGVKVAIPGGKTAHLYYDPTASKGYFQRAGAELMSLYAGPLDQASVERLATNLCITARCPEPKASQQDGKDIVYYGYVLGENWPEFAIGNYDYAASIKDGDLGIIAQKKGQAAFEQWHKQNFPSIVSLNKTVDDAYKGRF